MKSLYDIAMTLARQTIDSAGKLCHGNSKVYTFITGQRGLIDRIAAEAAEKELADSRPVWFHAASLGEYAVVRTIIDRVAASGRRVVLTFFSPTGICHFSGKTIPGVDMVTYLPLDSADNARRYVAAVRPSMAVFAVSEYWPNHLDELRRNGIPAYLVAAKITGKEPFFRWKKFRNALDAYTRIFAIDDDSVAKLASIGFTKSEKCGNPLFDNALKKAAEDFSDPIIEAYISGCTTHAPADDSGVFIAGSIHTDLDLDLVASLADRHPDTPFVIVPHETDPHTVATVCDSIKRNTVAYSQCTPDTRFKPGDVLVVDKVGILALIYRYGSLAYVGGGFTPYLHSLLEAVAYGLPVAFGPRTERKITPQQLVENGIGTIVNNPEEIELWFSTLYGNRRQLDKIRDKAHAYMDSGAGATDHIASTIGINPSETPTL